jgi:hypothetical protein
MATLTDAIARAPLPTAEQSAFNAVLDAVESHPENPAKVAAHVLNTYRRKAFFATLSQRTRVLLMLHNATSLNGDRAAEDPEPSLRQQKRGSRKETSGQQHTSCGPRAREGQLMAGR